jgi:proteasome lid subunit RPN8/RPN11
MSKKKSTKRKNSKAEAKSKQGIPPKKRSFLDSLTPKFKSQPSKANQLEPKTKNTEVVKDTADLPDKPKPVDTPVPSWIVIDNETLVTIEKHAYSVLDAEVGGMLFGSIEDGNTVIRGMVPARTKSVDQISLTFTHEVWDKILVEGSQLYPDSSIVGWYHTHPSFGLFLSEYDAFIQRNFFGSKGQLALVIDPIEGSLGWFTLGSDDNITKLGTARTERGPSVQSERESIQLSNSRTQSLTYTQTALVALGSALVFGLAGFGISQANTPVDLSKQVATQSYYLNRISQGDLNYVYVVQKGDTLVGLTTVFYGAGSSTDLILKNNPQLKGTIKAGDQINIYRPTGIGVDFEFVPPTATPAPTKSSSPSPSPSKSTPAPNPFPTKKS